MTVTVVLVATDPPFPVALREYVVVTGGKTMAEFDGASGNSETEGRITTESAPSVIHRRVADWPRQIKRGAASKRTFGREPTVTRVVALTEVVPDVAVRV
jgi:hypothetical protein